MDVSMICTLNTDNLLLCEDQLEPLALAMFLYFFWQTCTGQASAHSAESESASDSRKKSTKAQENMK